MPNGAEPVNRFTLPIPGPVHVGVTTYDAKDPDTFFPPVQPVRPPGGAPSVLLILAGRHGPPVTTPPAPASASCNGSVP